VRTPVRNLIAGNRMTARIVEIEVEPWYLHKLATQRGDEDTRTEVVLVLPRPAGRVLVITKPFYPPGTFRMPTGGVKPGETPEDAFRREVREETGLQSEPLLTIETMVLRCRSGDQTLDIASHLILGSPTSGCPRSNDPDEDISGYDEFDAAALRDAAERLRNLEGRWGGWGLFRAPAHLAAADFLAEEYRRGRI